MKEEQRIRFFKNKIREVLTLYKKEIGDTRYSLYMEMVERVNDYNELKEMADLEMQIDMLEYTRDFIKKPLEKKEVEIKDLRNVFDTKMWDNTSEDMEEEELIEDMDSEENLALMAYVLEKRLREMPEEEKNREIIPGNRIGMEVNDSIEEELMEEEYFGSIEDDTEDEDGIQIDEGDYFGADEDDEEETDIDLDISEGDLEEYESAEDNESDLDEEESDEYNNTEDNYLDDMDIGEYMEDDEDDEEDDSEDSSEDGKSVEDIEIDLDGIDGYLDDDDGDEDELDINIDINEDELSGYCDYDDDEDELDINIDINEDELSGYCDYDDDDVETVKANRASNRKDSNVNNRNNKLNVFENKKTQETFDIIQKITDGVSKKFLT